MVSQGLCEARDKAEAINECGLAKLLSSTQHLAAGQYKLLANGARYTLLVS